MIFQSSYKSHRLTHPTFSGSNFSDFGAHSPSFSIFWNIFWNWKLIFWPWRKSFEDWADRNVFQKGNPFYHVHPNGEIVAFETGRHLTVGMGPSFPLYQASFLWASWKRTVGPHIKASHHQLLPFPSSSEADFWNCLDSQILSGSKNGWICFFSCWLGQSSREP